MKWLFPDNDKGYGKKIVTNPVRVTCEATGREQDGIEIIVGGVDSMLEDSKRVCLTKREWKELRRQINNTLS